MRDRAFEPYNEENTGAGDNHREKHHGQFNHQFADIIHADEVHFGMDFFEDELLL